MGTTAKALPRVGAALTVPHLAAFRDWLIEGQRDLELQDVTEPDALDGNWRALARQARELLDGFTGRLGIHGPFDGLALQSADPRVRALAAARLTEGLEFGAAIGATHMVVHSPFGFFGDPWLTHAGPGLADQIGLIHRTLDGVFAVARDAGCTLVIENIRDKNPLPLITLVRSFDSEHVRLSVDTGHASITHIDGGPTPDGWIRAAGDLLAHVHLQDTDFRGDRHWPAGRGNLNWHAIFAELASLPQNPRLIVEVEPATDIPSAVAWYQTQGLAG